MKKFIQIQSENKRYFADLLVSPKFKKTCSGFLRCHLFLSVFFITSIFSEAFGQQTIFSQDFSSSTSVTSYVSATPNNGQFNAITVAGTNTVSISGGELSFTRGNNNGSFTRSASFSPTPTAIVFSLDLTVSSTSGNTNAAAAFQVGSSYSTATNGLETNANTYAQFGIDFRGTTNFRLRDITSGATTANYSVGTTYTITWAMNNSGSTLNYTAPNGTAETVANDRADLWIGTTRLFNEVTVQTAGGTMSDLKFALKGGTGTINIDNIIIYSINPFITFQPSDLSSCIGASASYGVTATGTSLTYQWRQGATNLTNGGNISGATTSTLTINPVALIDAAADYNVVITSTGGYSATSDNTALTVNPLPTITTAATAAATCFSSSAQNSTLSYSATTNTPTNYTITWNAAALAAGFVNLGSTALPATPMTLPIAANVAAGTYTGTVTVTNASGCASAGNSFTVTINPLPTITTAATAATRCFSSSAQNSTLTYSATTNSPTTYTVTWNAAALAAGLVNLSSTALPATPITFSIAANVAAGIYTGTVRVTNANGCTGTGSNFTLTINGLPTISTAATAAARCFNAVAQNATLTYSATTNTPTTYTITWNAAALSAGLVNVSSTALPASPIAVPIAAGVAAGTYTGTVTVSNANGCVSTGTSFTITINPLPTVTISPNYCIGGGVVRLTCSAQTSYLWSTGATIQFIDVSNAGNYSVTGTNAGGCTANASIAIAEELVTNGNFSSGNTGFITLYTYNNSPLGLYPESYYGVGANANYYHNNFFGTDHTTGIGNFMIVNGSSLTQDVWQQSVTVTPNTNYYFSAWAYSLNAVAPYAQLRFAVNDVQLGTTAMLTAGPTSNAGIANWVQFYGTWNSGSNTTAKINVIDLQTALGGNDFGLDDISFSTLAPVTMGITASGNTPVCTGTAINLTATVTGGSSPYTYSWTGPSSYTSTSQNPVISNAAAGNTGVYTVTVTDGNGCSASASTSSISVVTGSVTLTTGSGSNIQTLCNNSAITTITYNVGSPATGATVSGLPTGVSGSYSAGVFTISGTPTVKGIYNYTVTTTGSTCTVSKTGTITVNAPTMAGLTSACIASSTQLTGTGTAASSNPWISASTGVATVNSTGSVTGVSAGTSVITYTDNAGCTTSNIVTIKSLPTITGTLFLCNVGSTSSLTGSGIANAINPWVSSNTSVVIVNTTGVITAVAAGNSTITYTNDNGCSITATVTVFATNITGSLTLCSIGATTSLTGSGTPAASNPWVSATTSVATVNSAGVVTSVSVGTSIITYTNSSGCSVTATITVSPNLAAPIISPAAATICNGVIQTVTVTNYTAGASPQTNSSGAISVAIPDNSATGATSAIAVSGIPAAATITSVAINYNITHTYDGDLILNIKAPNGNILNLVNQRGGAGANFTNTTINSSSATAVSTGTAPFTGVYAPDASNGVGATSNVSNVTTFPSLYSIPNGNWVFSVRDNAGADVGNITSWSVTITYTVPSVTWQTNVNGLFTNAAATSAYVAQPTSTVYAKPTSTQTYTATVTSFGGCTNTQTVLVTVNPTPAIDGSLTTCAGFTTALTGTGTPAVSNPWVSSTTSIATVNSSGVVTGIASGTSVITYTNSNGCIVTATVTMNAAPVDKTPTAAATSICTGNSTNIQIALSQSGVNYQLRNNSDNVNIGSVVAGTGGTINFSTGTLSVTTTFNVVATFVSSSCNVQMVNTVTISVNPTGQWVGGSSGDWNTASNWCGGLPSAFTNVVIPAGATVNIQTANASANSITVAAAASLIMTGANNLNITAGGSFTNNGSFNASAGTGTVAFLGNGTINGTTTFKNIDTYGALNFGTASTISGTFSLQTGGSVVVNPPAYTCPSAVLLYKPGTVFTRGLEWTTASSGAGYPANVLVQNNTTVNFPAAGNGYVCYDVQVDAGSSLLQNYGGTSASLSVGRNIIINGILELGASTGGDISLGGNWTRNTGGTFTANDRKVTFDGTGNFSGNGLSMSTISAPASAAKNNEGGFGGENFAHLWINKTNIADSVVLLSNITVTRELGFTRGTFSLRNSDVTLVSNSTRTADIAPITTIANISIRYAGTGKFVVQRFIQNPTATRSWRLLTAPLQSPTAPSINAAFMAGVVNPNKNTPDASGGIYNPWPGYGTHITGPGGAYSTINGFDQGTTSSSILYGNSGVLSWLTPSSTLSTKVTDQQGWMLFVRGDRSFVIGNQYIPSANTILEPKGRINVGNISVPVTTGRQVIGNPYPSAISLLNVDVSGILGKLSSYHVWDPKMFTSFTQPGKWVSFTGLGSTFIQTTSASSYLSNGTIESGQAFLMDVVTPGTITFHESDKLPLTSSLVGIANGTGARPLENPVFPIFRSDIYAKTDTAYTLTDGVLNVFNSAFNNAASDEDAKKIISFNTKESLSILRDAVKIAIEKRSDIKDTDTIFFAMSKFNELPYRFRFQATDFAPGYEAFLEDKFTGDRLQLSTAGVSEIDFAITANPLSKAEDRFRVVFKSPFQTVLPVTFTSVKAWQQNKKIVVQWQVANEINIKDYEVEKSIDGTHFTTVNTTASQGSFAGNFIYNWLDENAVEGDNFYRIKSNGNNEKSGYSELVKVRVTNYGGSIHVYPNPVADGVIRLYFKNMAKGNYSLRLLTATGQTMNRTTFSNAGAVQMKEIQLTKGVAKGIYEIEVVHPGNIKSFVKVIVE